MGCSSRWCGTADRRLLRLLTWLASPVREGQIPAPSAAKNRSGSIPDPKPLAAQLERDAGGCEGQAGGQPRPRGPLVGALLAARDRGAVRARAVAVEEGDEQQRQRRARECPGPAARPLATGQQRDADRDEREQRQARERR